MPAKAFSPIRVIVEGSSIVLSFAQFLNAAADIAESVVLGKMTEVRFMQSSKAELPIEVYPSGIVTDLSVVLLRKASEPSVTGRLCILSGRVTSGAVPK